MRTLPLCAALVVAAMFSSFIGNRALAAETKTEAKPAAASNRGGESGVYGFSGALKAGTSMSGVMGECIWIYDADNKQQVAKGDCDKGKFRVALEPGHYVVRGPGGNQKIDVKPHAWVKIKSLVKIPGAL